MIEVFSRIVVYEKQENEYEIQVLLSELNFV